MDAPGIQSGARFLARPELQQRAAQVASGFDSLGIGKGDAVALLLRNDFPYLEATLGAGALGAFAVPINWHSAAEDVGYVLDNSAARALVVHADLLPAVEKMVPAGVTILVVDTPAELAGIYGLPPSDCRAPHGHTEWGAWRDGQDLWQQEPEATPFSVVYTSGTTGRPKGVKREPSTPEQQMKLLQLASRILGIAPDARTLIPAPLYHSAPNAAALFASMLAERLVLMPAFDPAQLLALIEQHRITSLHMVPSMFVRLLRLPPAERECYDLSSLRHVSHTAAPCPPEVKRQMIDWWGPVIYEYYGSTEVGAVAFCSSQEWLEHPGTVGRALDDALIKVLDEEGRPVPAGEVGEVYARLAAISDFTYQSNEADRQAIELDGLVTSGDLGYLDDDGFLFICDRKKDMVIFGGTNVYPAQIEAVLLEMPEVRDCAVFGIPDDDFGEVLAAAVEPEPGAVLDADAVKAFLTGRLASYQLPRLVEFRAELPREDSGKIFKRLLREPYWEGHSRQI